MIAGRDAGLCVRVYPSATPDDAANRCDIRVRFAHPLRSALLK
jgi:hypothetical protein